MALKRTNARKPYPKSLQRMILKARRRIETSFSQLTEQFNIERIWAKTFGEICVRLLSKAIAFQTVYKKHNSSKISLGGAFSCIGRRIEKNKCENHILRTIDKVIDFSFIYEEVEGLYSDKGRPGIDPVSLFKIVFIQYLFGIRSMRQTIREIEVNVAYRWFIGYSLTEPVAHFSIFGKNYVRRFAATNIFERIFKRILVQAEKTGYVDASAVFIDSTHIKASANKHKSKEIKVTKPLKQYKQELEEEINEFRFADGKKNCLKQSLKR